jgi:hypothetical protein
VSAARARHLDQSDPRHNRIEVPGLRHPVSLFHLTDCHLALADDRDPEAAGEVVRSQGVFRPLTPGGVDPWEVFAAALARAREEAVDAIVLTGDVLQIPSRAGVEALERSLRATGLPWVYALGNHDWWFPHLEWSTATRRAHHPRFGPVAGHAPAHQSRWLHGLRLVTLDNSTYQLDPEQVEFLERELAAGEPCLLCTHIPAYLPGLAPAVVERWGAPIMVGAPGWTAQTRARWCTGEDEPGTRRFGQLLAAGPPAHLVGIACGHVHLAHADPVAPGVVQYVTQAGFEGGYRVMHLLPGG